jgi:hypothetical protein
LSTVAPKVLQALRSVDHFSLPLDQQGHFQHKQVAGWLSTSGAEALAQLKGLQRKLFEAFPECSHLNDDPDRDITDFVPHLSVGQWPDLGSAEQDIGAHQVRWQP